MKKLYLLIMFTSCVSMCVGKSPNNIELHEPQTWYQQYFFTKEMLKYIFITHFWMDISQLQDVGLHCAQCHFRMSGIEAWTWILVAAHTKFLNQYKKLLYRKASLEEIEKFLLKIQHDPLFVCPICEINAGWVPLVDIKL